MSARPETTEKLPPQPIEIELAPDVVAKLLTLEQSVNLTTTARDEYQRGLAAGLGYDLARIMSLDPFRGVLILTPDPEPEAG